MQLDDLTPEQARELAKPRGWTVEELLEKSPHVQPRWMRAAVDHYYDSRPLLEQRMVEMMDAQTSEASRLHMGLVLFFLAHPRGREALMAGLRSEDSTLRKLVLDQFKELRSNDLGVGGVAGKLPATCEEVFAAIVPLLQDPTSYEGNIALGFSLEKSLLSLSHSYTLPLLRHDNQAVRDKVALAYLGYGRDDGAFDVLANDLFAPDISIEKQSRTWLERRHKACTTLKTCAETTQDPDVKMRAGLLTLRVVEQTQRARRAQGRFPDWRDERLPLEVLLQTIVLTRPAGAEEVLLHQAILRPEENLRLRSLALLSYVDLTGTVPSCAQSIIDAVVAQPDAGPRDPRLEQFAARKMIGLPTLLAAARNPAWCYMAIKAIGTWPGGAEDGLKVEGLITALEALAARAPAKEDGLLEHVAALLRGLPRTSSHDRTIITALKNALAIAKQNTKRPWIAQGVLHQLVMFGEVSADAESNIEPWDATSAHWQRNDISWEEASPLLVEAGAADRACGTESRLNVLDIMGGLLEVLGNRFVVAGLEDEGYHFPRHEVLLEKMAAIVRPPVGTDAFSQTGEWHGNSALCRVKFVYQDRVYGFEARPIGDWLDVWALVDGFNGFLRELGRPERIFRLADPAEWGGAWGIFICAHEERFTKANEHLRLPLQPRRE